MESPYERRRRKQFTFHWWELMLNSIGVALLFFSWELYLYAPTTPHPSRPAAGAAGNAPYMDVLPTPTPEPDGPRRTITFPGAMVTAPIIHAARASGSWETRHLGDAVGHLAGTSWFDDPGGNIVLVAHVETAFGTRGPFAHLEEAMAGDEIILREGEREEHFRVVSTYQVTPDNINPVAQDGRPRLTLITCSNWDYRSQRYLNRVVGGPEPVEGQAAQGG